VGKIIGIFSEFFGLISFNLNFPFRGSTQRHSLTTAEIVFCRGPHGRPSGGGTMLFLSSDTGPLKEEMKLFLSQGQH
jgi:hypothetical protein